MLTVTGELAAAEKCRATNDKGTFPRDGAKKGLVGGIEDLVAKQVVNIVLLRTVCVGGIGGDGMDSKITLEVVNDVRGVVYVSDAWSWSRPQIVGRCCRRGSWGRSSCCRTRRSRHIRSVFGGISQIEPFRIPVHVYS